MYEEEISGVEITELRPEKKNQKQKNLTLRNYLPEKKKEVGEMLPWIIANSV